MPRELNILVIANRTAMSDTLEETMRARVEECPSRFTLVIPAGRGLEGRRAVEQMEAHMREIGLEVRAIAGDPDPLRAVLEVYSPADFDEIIVSTLPSWGVGWTTRRRASPGLVLRICGAAGRVRHLLLSSGPDRDRGPARTLRAPRLRAALTPDVDDRGRSTRGG